MKAFRTLTISVVFCLLAGVPAMADDVVLLHSASQPDAWTHGLEQGFCTDLEQACPLTTVFLGPASRGDDFFETRFEKLRKTWAGKSPSAVIADGNTAFAFVRKFGEELFGAAPTLFLGMDHPGPDLLAQCGNCTGIPLTMDVRGTIDLLFHLRPETTTVVGIMDGSFESLRLRQAVENAMEPYLNRARILFPGHEPGDDTGLDAQGIADVASSVPLAGCILYLGFETDNKGREMDESVIVRDLAARSAGPTFVLTDRWMGTGVLGGVMVGSRDLGHEARQMVDRIRKGAAVRNLLPGTVPGKPWIDLTALARFGIPAASLPKGTATVNAPPTPEVSGTAMPSGVLATLLALVALVGLYLFVKRSAARKDTRPESRP